MFFDTFQIYILLKNHREGRFIIDFSDHLQRVTRSFCQTRKWTSSDGSEKYATEVVLQGFNAVLQILDGRKSSNNNTNYDDNNIDEELEVDISENFIDEKSDDDIQF